MLKAGNINNLVAIGVGVLSWLLITTQSARISELEKKVYSINQTRFTNEDGQRIYSKVEFLYQEIIKGKNLGKD